MTRYYMFKDTLHTIPKELSLNISEFGIIFRQIQVQSLCVPG